MASSLSVANLVDRAAQKFGDKEFIKFDHPMEYENIPQGHEGTSATYNEALQITNCIAAMMKNELGVKPGDRIAVAVTNIPNSGLRSSPRHGSAPSPSPSTTLSLIHISEPTR